MANYQSTSVNKQRINNFFAAQKVQVIITAEKDKGAPGNTHVIKLEESNNAKAIQKFHQLVDHVFPEHHQVNELSYGVMIDKDFVICRQCGCSEMKACPGGCYWVEPDLCSACNETTKLHIGQRMKINRK